MSIEITPEIEKVVQGIFAGGQYASQGEVISTALSLLQQRDQLRRELQQGVDELDSGQRLDAGQVFTELRRHAEALDRHAE